MRILLLTDGSDRSAEAARWLARHAGQFKTPPEIHVYFAHPPLPYPGAAQVVGRGAVESYQRENSEAALAGAAAILRDAGLEFQKSWEAGPAAQAIEAKARSLGADLVVMGTHGHGAFLNMALGSVATKCIAMLEIPVVVVPGDRSARRTL